MAAYSIVNGTPNAVVVVAAAGNQTVQPGDQLTSITLTAAELATALAAGMFVCLDATTMDHRQKAYKAVRTGKFVGTAAPAGGRK